jgi:hypothetical protein
MYRIRLTFRYYSYLIHAPDAEWQVNHDGVNEWVFNTGQCLSFVIIILCIAFADVHFRGSSAQSRWYSNLNASFSKSKTFMNILLAPMFLQ